VDDFLVTGGRQLAGSVRVSGSKNGTLPLLAASLLIDGVTVIDNVPDIFDVGTMIQMLRALGAKCDFVGPAKLRIDASKINLVEAPYDLVRKMRGSFYVAGPLLARFGACQVPLPGGCVIGSRPVDFHIQGFKALGAEVSERHGVMSARAKRLHGTRIYMDPRLRSVGATVNLMLAASLAVLVVRQGDAVGLGLFVLEGDHKVRLELGIDRPHKLWRHHADDREALFSPAIQS